VVKAVRAITAISTRVIPFATAATAAGCQHRFCRGPQFAYSFGLPFQQHYVGERGGQPAVIINGKRGEDCLLRVPVGTVLWT